MSATFRMEVCIAVFVCVNVYLVTSVTIPPKITRQSSKDIFYKKGETIKMECEASGEPTPSYSWKRAEKTFTPEGNDERIVMQKGIGTLIINSPEDKDEGIYQCFATNSQGVAATDKFNLKMAKLDEFMSSDSVTHKVQLGNSLTLNCQSPNSVPDAQIFWVINNDPVFWDSRVTMDYEDRLYFTYVIAEDYQEGAAYQCVAYNELMRMSVVGPPHIIEPQGTILMTSPMEKLWPKSRFDEQALLGSEFKMKCIFSGNPPPIVKWQKQNGEFSSRVQLGNSGGQEIVIKNVQHADAGTYLCDGTRDQENVPLEMSFNLNINSRPFWISKPKDVSIGEHGTAQFECLADGVPKPSIKWFVNGEPLHDALVNDPRLDHRFHHIEDDKIILESVTLLDTMVFQCNISNIHGYVWAEAFLNVLSEAPTILAYPQDTKVAESEPFEMVCQITGKPDPTITWFKDELQITGGRYIIRESGNLYTEAAVLSDAGVYRCYAENFIGNQTASSTLIVRRKTVIQSKPGDLEVQRGVYAKFTCSGTTDPEEIDQMKTTWLKDGELVGLGTRLFLNIQDNSLTISGTEQRDTGTYTCVISNGLDNDTASARLVVTDIPDAPYDLTVKEQCVKGGFAELEWIAGSFNNAPIQYFLIEYMTKVDPNRWVFAIQIDYRKDTAFIPLAAGMEYSFRVSSFNKIGASSPSVATNLTCSTTSSTPTQNPRNVRTIGDKPGMLHVEWTPVPPEHQGGKNFSYIISLQRDGDAASTVFTDKIVDWRIYGYVYPATGFAYVRYRITVKSRNADGDSAEQAPIVYGYSAEGAPLVYPSDLNVANIQSDSALFTWQFDRSQIGKVNSQIRGEFRGFKIQIWEQNRQAETIREHDVLPEDLLNNLTLNTFNARVPHLTPNTRLQARVAVLNNFFVSKPSDIIAFVTPPGLPGPVELLEDRNIGDNHVNLQWRNPVDTRGDIVGYDIGFQKVHGLQLEELQDRMPQIDDQYATTAMLSGLLPNTKYRIHIWARTAAGRGEGFFIERTTTNPSVPMIPRFTIASVGTDYINVTWWRDAYQNSGSVVYVEHRKEDGAEWFSNTPDVSRDWVKIGFLQPGFKYTIRLVVSNGETKRLSQEEDVTTDGAAKAYDVGANLGWFLGMIFSVLLEIILVILFIICYRRGFRFKTGQSEIRTYRNGSETYTDKEEIPRVSKDFGPEPGGFTNDIYRDGYDDGYDDDPDGFENYDERGSKYDDGYSDRADSPRYGSEADTNYRNVAEVTVGVGREANDYEDYNINEGVDPAHNKSDHSDTDSYAKHSSNYSSDNEVRGRLRNEQARGDGQKASKKEVSSRLQKETRHRDPKERQEQNYQRNDSSDDRQKDQDYRDDRRQRADRYNKRQDSRQVDKRRPDQETSFSDNYSTDHDDSYSDRNPHDSGDRYNPSRPSRRNDRYKEKRPTEPSDRYNVVHEHGHSHSDPNHDHEKCDDVVDEFKRYSGVVANDDTSSETTQSHVSTFV